MGAYPLSIHRQSIPLCLCLCTHVFSEGFEGIAWDPPRNWIYIPCLCTFTLLLPIDLNFQWQKSLSLTGIISVHPCLLLKRHHPQRKLLFQTSSFSGYVHSIKTADTKKQSTPSARYSLEVGISEDGQEHIYTYPRCTKYGISFYMSLTCMINAW